MNARSLLLALLVLAVLALAAPARPAAATSAEVLRRAVAPGAVQPAKVPAPEKPKAKKAANALAAKAKATLQGKSDAQKATDRKAAMEKKADAMTADVKKAQKEDVKKEEKAAAGGVAAPDSSAASASSSASGSSGSAEPAPGGKGCKFPVKEVEANPMPGVDAAAELKKSPAATNPQKCDGGVPGDSSSGSVVMDPIPATVENKPVSDKRLGLSNKMSVKAADIRSATKAVDNADAAHVAFEIRHEKTCGEKVCEGA